MGESLSGILFDAWTLISKAIQIEKNDDRRFMLCEAAREIIEVMYTESKKEARVNPTENNLQREERVNPTENNLQWKGM